MIIYVKMDTEHTRGVPKLKALGAEIAFPAGGPRRQYKSLQFPAPLHRKCKRFPPKKVREKVDEKRHQFFIIQRTDF